MKDAVRRRRHKALIHILFWLAFLIAAVAVVSNTVIKTSVYIIETEKLPAGTELRIAQLSDLHGKGFYNGENKHLISVLEDTKPDIIVMTGDMVDARGDEDEEMTAFRSVAQAAVALAPTYYITGNHEWTLGDTEGFIALVESWGIRVLRGDYDVLDVGGAKVVLAGIDDPNGYADQPTLARTMAKVRAEQPDADYTVMLCHRNNELDSAAAAGCDLVLCGHCHGGVVYLPFIGGVFGTDGKLFPEYDSGLFTKDGTTMIVSRGLGNHTKLPRWGSIPHVPVIVLRGSDG